MFKQMRTAVSIIILVAFVSTSIKAPAYAQVAPMSLMPKPGAMINLTHAYIPVLIKGLKVHPENPLLFDFILDTGKSGLKINSPEFKTESQKLIKYFLASLTIKEDDLWVNLSPYEKNRIIPDPLGQTELGRDMLAQDYILKQLTASLIYPEKQLGKEFWNTVYAKAQQEFGTSDIPVNTFNKVWIVADKAKILERNNVGYVVGSHLKVMLEEDYLALEKHTAINMVSSENKTHSVAAQVVREIILPALEKEVNQGKNFAPLRQMFYSMILATWYKTALKNALLNQVYSNKEKTSGVLADDPMVKEKIFQQYLQAYKKGVFNFIKEDINAVSKQPMPRKYFSGGLARDLGIPKILDREQAGSPEELASMDTGDLAMVTTTVGKAFSQTMEDGLPWETEDYLHIFQRTQAAGEEVHFVARSEEMLKIIRQIKGLSTNPLRTPIIIFGLTGTGKELTWKIIHYLSPRSAKEPIVMDINQLNLFETGELNKQIFGTKDQIGLLEHGQDSTIVLDGVEDASPAVQGLLLRILESKKLMRIDGTAPINLSNVQFVATRNKEFPKGYRQDLINRFRATVNLPDLSHREDDRVFLFEFYNEALSKKLGQVWRPLSLEAGLLLASDGSKDEKQVRGVEEIIERVLTEGNQDEPYVTATDLVAAGLPTDSIVISSSQIPADVNDIPIVLHGWSREKQKHSFVSNPYLSIVHGIRPYFDLMTNPAKMPVKAPAIDQPSAEKIIAGFNRWFSTPANLDKLGIRNVAVRSQEAVFRLENLTLSLSKQLPNGEYVVQMNFGLEGNRAVQGSVITGFPEGASSLWVALLSWMTHRTMEGSFSNKPDEDFRHIQMFILKDFDIDFGFNKRGWHEGNEDNFIGTYLNFYDYDVTKGFLKDFDKIKSEITDEAMTAQDYINGFQRAKDFSTFFALEKNLWKLMRENNTPGLLELVTEVLKFAVQENAKGGENSHWYYGLAHNINTRIIGIQVRNSEIWVESWTKNAGSYGWIKWTDEVANEIASDAIEKSSEYYRKNTLNRFKNGGDVVGLHDLPAEHTRTGIDVTIQTGLIPELKGPQETAIAREHNPVALLAQTVKSGQLTTAVRAGGDVLIASEMLSQNEIADAHTAADALGKKVVIIAGIDTTQFNVEDQIATAVTNGADGIKFKPAGKGQELNTQRYIEYAQRQYPNLVIMVAGGVNAANRNGFGQTSKAGMGAGTIDEIKTIAQWAKTVQDSAQTVIPPGGIDLNAKNMSMDVSGQDIDMKFNPAMIAEFQRGDFSGIVANIIRIIPIKSALPMMGAETSPA